jgi:hypothetical protein
MSTTRWAHGEPIPVERDGRAAVYVAPWRGRAQPNDPDRKAHSSTNWGEFSVDRRLFDGSQQHVGKDGGDGQPAATQRGAARWMLRRRLCRPRSFGR